jgi:hypothetical protein
VQYTDRLNIIYEPPVTLREQPVEGHARILARLAPNRSSYRQSNRSELTATPSFLFRTADAASTVSKKMAETHIYALCGSKIF